MVEGHGLEGEQWSSMEMEGPGTIGTPSHPSDILGHRPRLTYLFSGQFPNPIKVAESNLTFMSRQAFYCAEVKKMEQQVTRVPRFCFQPCLPRYLPSSLQDAGTTHTRVSVD